jgi:hypothetical protein
MLIVSNIQASLAEFPVHPNREFRDFLFRRATFVDPAHGVIFST